MLHLNPELLRDLGQIAGYSSALRDRQWILPLHFHGVLLESVALDLGGCPCSSQYRIWAPLSLSLPNFDRYSHFIAGESSLEGIRSDMSS